MNIKLHLLLTLTAIAMLTFSGCSAAHTETTLSDNESVRAESNDASVVSSHASADTTEYSPEAPVNSPLLEAKISSVLVFKSLRDSGDKISETEQEGLLTALNTDKWDIRKQNNWVKMSPNIPDGKSLILSADDGSRYIMNIYGDDCTFISMAEMDNGEDYSATLDYDADRFKRYIISSQAASALSALFK